MEKKMRKKNNYRKRKLKPKIRLCIFIILIILTFNFINNILKPSNASKNISIENVKPQAIDNAPKDIQQNDTFSNGSNNVYEVSPPNDITNKDTDISNVNNSERDINKFKDKKLIAFTFDDGPSYKGTNKLLDNLNKYNARVTFFVVGSRVLTYKDTLKRAYNMGNVIGSHTYSHKDLLKLSNSDILNEIRKTNDDIESVIGERAKYLRPPYGNTNKNIKNLSNMYTILWDLDTEDWKYKDKNKISQYIIDNAHDGAIVLLHDLYETSVDGALLAMEELEKEGYAFVTIEEMVTLKGINLDKTKNYFQFDK